MPKSMIFAGPPRTTMMLAGFTSRWTTPRLVRVREPLGDLRADVERGLRLDEAAREQALQLAPGHELHRHVDDVAGVADVEDRDDVRVAEAAGGLRLLVEALLVLRALLRIGRHVDRLDRDRAVEHRVGRLVDDAHRPAPELAEDGVAAEGLRLAPSGRARAQNPACLRKSFHIRRTRDGCSWRRLLRLLRAARRRRPRPASRTSGAARAPRPGRAPPAARPAAAADAGSRSCACPARPRSGRAAASGRARRRRSRSRPTARSRARRPRAASRGLRALARDAHREPGGEEAGDRRAGDDERAPARRRAAPAAASPSPAGPSNA